MLRMPAGISRMAAKCSAWVSHLSRKVWARWALLAAVLLAGALVAVLLHLPKKRWAFTVKPTDVVSTAQVTGEVQPTAIYQLYFGAAIAQTRAEPHAPDACGVLATRNDPEKLLGPVRYLVRQGVHVTSGQVIAAADTTAAQRELEAARAALTQDQAILKADQAVASRLASPSASPGVSAATAPSAAPSSSLNPAPGPSLPTPSPSLSASAAASPTMTNEQLAADEDRVDAAEHRMAAAQQVTDSSSIIAPADGIVEAVTTALGAVPSCHSPAMVLRPDTLQVDATIPVEVLRRVTIGQRAVVNVPDAGRTRQTRVTTPPTSRQGAVSTTPPAYAPPGAVTHAGAPVTYHLLLGLPVSTDGVLPGMRAQVTLVLAERSRVLAVPNSAVKHDGNGSYVSLLRCDPDSENCGSQTSERGDVQTGLVGDFLTEITGGLTAGDEVVLPGPVPTITPLPSVTGSSPIAPTDLGSLPVPPPVPSGRETAADSNSKGPAAAGSAPPVP
ncbi:HlyD family efflux transporter periplasmic adaptor subunit [Kitasatospora sp. NPDC048540]|uniref:efflux RND transporter periplasmic adaptor subunit n=1 Tax=unclassified Kitasatospora TaxID=2633591 RepID=UPI00053B270D